MKLFLLLGCLLTYVSGKPKDGDVKLVNGTSEENGLLMVYYNSSWGYVCDGGGSLPFLGQAACRNLNGGLIRIRGKVAAQSSSYLLDEVNCKGRETNLDECAHGPWGVHNCANGPHHVHVTCAIVLEGTDPKDGDVRLVDGTSPDNGVLMVYHEDRWDFVYTYVKYPPEAVAKVACRNLKKTYLSYYAGVSIDSNTYWLCKANCSGSETNLNQCPSQQWNNRFCDNYTYYHMYVSCGPSIPCDKDNTCANGDVRLAGGSSKYSGLLLVYYNSKLDYVCDRSKNLTSLAQVACRSLHPNRTVGSVTGRTYIRYGYSGNYLLDNVNCKGDEQSLAECSHDPWGYESCGIHNHISITCRELVPCDTAPCDSGCIDNPDNLTYTCTCETGYFLDTDGKTCKDVDECLLNNGDCSHICVNTVGSRTCECPRYLYLDTDKKTCTADDIFVDCSSPLGMTITMDRRKLFFLPESLTLTDTSCTSKSNSTHIWLYTDYNKCSTAKKIVDREIIYSNSVLDSKTADEDIQFFNDIVIPFHCTLSTDGTISQGISVVSQQRVIMRIEGRGPLMDGNMDLLDGDQDTAGKLSFNNVKQGEVVYVKLTPKFEGLVVKPRYCEILSQDQAKFKNLIADGKADNFIVKVLPSSDFRFSYPVFAFRSKGQVVQLECHSILVVKSSLLNQVADDNIITKDALLIAQNSSNMSGQQVIDPSKGVTIKCTTQAMTLTIDPAVASGITWEHLHPLKKECPGFSMQRKYEKFVYTIPLLNCGSQVENIGSMLKFTNSLISSRGLNSIQKDSTEVTLTHSCSYPLVDYANILTYTVRPSSFSVSAKNKKLASFEVNLKMFSDEKFKELINSGGAVSIAEGRQLFGDIGVTSSDPYLRVALNECKASPTNNADDPNSQVVIKNGCKTSYGAKVLSPSRFSVISKLFSDHGKSDLYVHCSIVVCDSSNLTRCERKCDSTLPGDVIGKRSE